MIPRAPFTQKGQRGGARLPPDELSGPPTQLSPAGRKSAQSRLSEGNLQVNDPKLNTLTTVWRH